MPGRRRAGEGEVQVSGSARRPGSPLGLHRVLEPAGVLPQAARRLDPDPAIWPDEVLVAVDRLNLDAASYRQLREAHGGDPEAMRAAVLAIVAERGKMQNPVTGSGGMLTGVVREVGPRSPLGLRPATGSPPWSRSASPRWRLPAGWRTGTAGPSRCRARAMRSCSAGRSPPRSPVTCPRRWHWPSWTCAAPPR